QRLTHALGDAAVALAIDHHRVQDSTAVVDRQVPHKSHLARLTIDLYDGQVHTERERLAFRFEKPIGFQTRLVTFGDLAVIRARGDGAKRGRAVGYPAYADPPLRKFDVRRRRLKRVGGQADDLLPYALRCAEHSATADGRRPTAKRS